MAIEVKRIGFFGIGRVVEIRCDFCKNIISDYIKKRPENGHTVNSECIFCASCDDLEKKSHVWREVRSINLVPLKPIFIGKCVKCLTVSLNHENNFGSDFFRKTGYSSGGYKFPEETYKQNYKIGNHQEFECFKNNSRPSIHLCKHEWKLLHTDRIPEEYFTEELLKKKFTKHKKEVRNLPKSIKKHFPGVFDERETFAAWKTRIDIGYNIEWCSICTEVKIEYIKKAF